MRYWQVVVVLHDYAPHAGKATITVNVEAEDGPQALALALERLASRTTGVAREQFIVSEQVPPSQRVPKLGSRGQVLCDGCLQCSKGYHCSPCAKARIARAKSRAEMQAHQRREARRAMETS